MSNDGARGQPIWKQRPIWGWGGAAIVALATRPLALAIGLGGVFALAWVAGRLPTLAGKRLTWSQFGSATLPEMLVRTALLAGVGVLTAVGYSLVLR